MTRFALALAALLFAASAWAQTWEDVEVLPREVAQPYFAGSQSLAPGTAGAAVTVCPRRLYLDGTIFRSYSGAAAHQGMYYAFGGGHAGHPGNDLDRFDIAARAWLPQPYAAECPPPYRVTALAAAYLAGGLTITVADPAGFDVSQRVWLGNPSKTVLRVAAITGPVLTVTIEANPGPAAAGTSASTPNGTWRAIKGGGVATRGFSPTGKPWVHHTYDLLTVDTVRHRLLFMSGNGLMAWDIATGAWSLLAGRDRYAGEVVVGDTGSLAYDEVTDSVAIFASDTKNGAARGIYRYTFDAAGEVATSVRVASWPTLLNWSFSYKFVTAVRGPGRLVYLMLTPVIATTNAPPNRLFTYHLDTHAVTWDQTLIPGTPAYDGLAAGGRFQTWDRRAATGQLYFWTPGGLWIKTETTGAWHYRATTGGAPSIARWTFTYDAASDVFVGLDPRSLYCGVSGAACGGLTDTWVLAP